MTDENFDNKQSDKKNSKDSKEERKPAQSGKLSDAKKKDESKKEKKQEAGAKKKTQKAKVIVEEKPKEKLINFESFFLLYRKKNPSIKLHHKIPMKAFCEKHLGKGKHTHKDFKEVIKKY